eukprot:UN26101
MMASVSFKTYLFNDSRDLVQKLQKELEQSQSTKQMLMKQLERLTVEMDAKPQQQSWEQSVQYREQESRIKELSQRVADYEQRILYLQNEKQTVTSQLTQYHNNYRAMLNENSQLKNTIDKLDSQYSKKQSET